MTKGLCELTCPKGMKPVLKYPSSKVGIENHECIVGKMQVVRSRLIFGNPEVKVHITKTINDILEFVIKCIHENII
jgi:hypothetical protein